ncbi:hydantoinase B/oxoprolinase family protein [uncultured Ramlibacter sp.]|uniref:hydantoinase B/oxoprolinase family protein n=1 Tax=uncultured Ramlibacter sp. TaxID=260755 RepID=UPI00262529D4|nr:hydantoinase B/oxoprolinase family protein [uncultured Ramlibacter sp.]
MKRVALVCTQGFADVLTLGRQNRADPYARHVPPSLWISAVPDAMRFEVAGRIEAAGREAQPLDCSDLVAQLQALPQPPEAIAVCLLFAHANPAHELQVQASLQQAFPHAQVLCSHAVLPQSGEFERSVATVQAAGGALSDAGAVQSQRLQDLSATLEDLADRMQACLVANAVSSVVREAMDCAAAVFLPDGRMLAQARSLPLLLGSLAPAVAGLLDVFAASAMREGDGYLSNDPWSGGTHLPDFVLLRPVLLQGRVQVLVACILHHQDVGGSTPGSVPTNATSIHQEGLRIPPVQLYAGGALDAPLSQLLRANSRMPDNLAGDLQAQWLALAQGAQEVQTLVATQGAQAFAAQCEAAIAASEAAVRAALVAAPDGDYSFDDALDGDGISDAPVRIAVCLRKRGAQLEVDLTQCAPQTAGPVNASRGAVWAAVSYFARMLAPQAASNHGCTAALQLRSTPGTVVDPAFPAAVNARTNLVKLLANALLGAWAQASPQACPAPNAGVAVVLSLSGSRSDGARWMYTEIIASAAGGAPWSAGGSGVSTDVGNARSTPAEVIEAQAPLRMERVALRRGSGGAGRHAGGDGVLRAYRLLEGEGLVSYRGERHSTPAQGAAGGRPGACGSARIERADGSVQPLPAKARVAWRAGDLLVIETAGGGGWGQPAAPGAQFA